MSVFAVGAMFWGKAQSYPWWPSVIVTDTEGVWKRRNKKIGIQYHVQFIGDEYDPSWISEEFLVEFHGKDRFEQYVIDQLNSALPVPDKLKFDMRMSQSIKESWTQACDSAELLYSLDIDSRLAQLPKSAEAYNVTKSTRKRNFPRKENFVTDFKSEPLVKKVRTKKSATIITSNVSETEDKANVELDAKEIKKEAKKNRKKTKQRYSNVSDQDDDYTFDSYKSEDISASNEINISNDIEEHCFRAYLVQEKLNLLPDNNIPVDQSTLEKTLKDRWSALDIETKLLYVNDEVNIIGTSQSKVSGRKIRVPSRLRSSEEVSRIKKTSKSKVAPDLFSKKGSRTNLSTSVLSIKTENVNNAEINSSVSSPNVMHQNTTFHEIIDDSLWRGLTPENCLTNIMKIVIQGSIPEVPNTCYYCFIPLLPNNNILICNGECHASYHAECATVNKIMRSEGSHLCIYCDQKQDICCICRNSKYMNKKFLVKCQKENCSLYFHVTCAKVLTFVEVNENEMVTCPNHSCLTCTREDTKHPCNTEGSLVSCIKCQLSYHDNLVCIPAGCRILSKNRIICYRHFDNDLERKDTEQLLRCFHCFEENATLKCCRCRAIFHPKCLGLATYSDLLKEYICTTCKLDQPMFYGQITWILRNDKWIPAEIIDDLQFDDDISKRTQSLLLNDLENGICYFANRSELIPFVIGLSILKDVMNISNTVLQLAKLRNILYWNWRSRLRPVTSNKFPFLDQIHLLKHSLKDSHLPEPNVDTYNHININIYPQTIKKFLSSFTSNPCCCTSLTGTCSTNACNNFVNHVECTESNCSNTLCNNHLFTKTRSFDPCIIQSSISGQGVQLTDCVEENEFLGECTGTILTVESVLKQMYEREHLTSVSYMFQLTEDLFLDCQKTGNEWRHLNHSCNPNSRLSFRNVSGSLRLAVLSLRSISKEEITIDYMANGLLLKYGFICQCNSNNCSKIIGPSSIFLNTATLIIPRCCINAVKKSEDISDTISNLPLKSSLNVTVTDDSFPDRVTCYKCGNHGEIITCDKSNCKKRYHLSCIDASSKPRGLWFCPVHFCYFCGQSSTKVCSHCPISCCNNDLTLHEQHKCSHMIEDDYSNHSAEIIEECMMDPLDTVIFKKENVNNIDEEMNERAESVKSHVEDNITYENQVISGHSDIIPITDSDIRYTDFIITTDKNAEANSSIPTEIKSTNDTLSFQRSFLDSLSYPRESVLESINLMEVDHDEEVSGVDITTGSNNESAVEDISGNMNDDNERNSAPRNCDFENVRYECLPCRIEDDEKVISPPVIDE